MIDKDLAEMSQPKNAIWDDTSDQTPIMYKVNIMKIQGKKKIIAKSMLQKKAETRTRREESTDN